MTKTKKAISLFIAAAVMFCGCKTADPAESFYEYEDILSETGKVLGIKITACSLNTAEIRIPEFISGKKVLAIGYRQIDGWNYKGAFESCSSDVKRIIIPEGVVTIEGRVFSNSITLQNVYLPESLAYLGNNSFSYCEGLTDIEIPENVTVLDGCEFYGCTNLESVTLHEGLTYIGHQTFGNCISLEKTELPSTVTEIESYAFRGCTSLSEISLPDGLLSIGEMAFDGCESLTDVTVPDTVETIWRHAFSGCFDIVVHYRGMDYTYPELYDIYYDPAEEESSEFFGGYFSDEQAFENAA